MVFVSEQLQKRKLDKKKINIKTIYLDNGVELERNTDGSVDDDIDNGIRIKKEYYYNDELRYTETDFDPRIEYNFLDVSDSDKEHKCRNCGMTSKKKEYNEGCPFCGTFYNINYTGKNLSRNKYYERILKNKRYRIIICLVVFLLCFFTLIYINKITSRSYNMYDLYRLVLGLILEGLLSFVVLYNFAAYLFVSPLKRMKDKENSKLRLFWNHNSFDKISFFNNFYYEVRKYYYNMEDVVDFDLIDFESFIDYSIGDDSYIEVEAYIRTVRFTDDFNIEYDKKRFIFKHNKYAKKYKKNSKMLCYSCGKVVNSKKSKCEKCNSDIKYLQEWILQ